MRRNLIKSLHSCAAIKGVATIPILALAMVMAGYSVETGTSALRGRLVEVSLSAKYAIAGRSASHSAPFSTRPVQRLSCSCALQPADGTWVQDFGRLLYIGVVCGASRDSREQLRPLLMGSGCVGILPDSQCALVISTRVKLSR